MAPQFTATKGLARRSLEPWIARASMSLPTPDLPSSNTGMLEAATLSAAASTLRIADERVTMSAMVSVLSRLRVRRRNSPASALLASALRNVTCSRSGLAGLTTKSQAPAFIADTTLSMPPCAVCTITGISSPASRMRAMTASPSRSGITRSSTTQSTCCLCGPLRRWRAACPLSASKARWPKRLTMLSIRRRCTGSSSTISTTADMLTPNGMLYRFGAMWPLLLNGVLNRPA